MTELTYVSYLKLESLLKLQEPLSTPPEHDEMLFITIHQVYELWFKAILHELEKLKHDFSSGELYGAIHTFKRLLAILKTLVQQFDILETMTPVAFAAFRDQLGTASGFQSYQFREFEFMMGFKHPDIFEHTVSFVARTAFEKRYQESSVMDCFYGFLADQGVTIPEVLRLKSITSSTQADATIQCALLNLYKTRPDLAILFELMVDFDEGFQEWKYRHMKLAERMIGNKRGTGGPTGVDYLKTRLFQPLFPDLWAIRNLL